jgi:hypothetical protein
MSFGALILVFLFGVSLFGFVLRPEIQDTATQATSTSTLPESTHTLLTQADTGTTLVLTRSDDAQLRLSHRWRWSEPHTTGSVELTPIAFIRDPGYDAWAISPRKAGTATITATGTPGGKRFRLTVRVR